MKTGNESSGGNRPKWIAVLLKLVELFIRLVKNDSNSNNDLTKN